MTIADARFPRLGALSVAAVTASLALSGAVASTAAADGPGYGAPWLVTVGDSSASGEAGRWAGNTNGSAANVDRLGQYAYGEPYSEAIPGCHRSKTATSTYAISGVYSKNFACSGAKTFSYYTREGQHKPGLDDPSIFYDPSGRKSQTQELQQYAATHNVKAVVVTIGANNYGFEDVVKHCLGNFLSSPSWAKNLCSDDVEMTSRFTASEQGAQTERVKNALLNVRTAMQNAGYSTSQYSIIARTYWSPIPSGGQFRYPETNARQSTGGCGIWDADATWANNVVIGTVNSTLKNAATATGLPNIKVVDQQSMLNGRRLCENGVGLLEEKNLPTGWSTGAVDLVEWVAQIRTVSTLYNSPYQLQESAHASYWGQMAMRSCLRQAYNGGSVRGGNCLRAANGLNSLGEPQMQLVQPPPPSLSVSLNCEGTGDYAYVCDQFTSGGTAPYAVKWYVNGSYVSGYDNYESISRACNPNIQTNVKVVATDANGATGQASRGVVCVADAF